MKPKSAKSKKPKSQATQQQALLQLVKKVRGIEKTREALNILAQLRKVA